MIDVSQMGKFGQISGNSATIYRQGDAGEIQSGGTYRGPLGRIFRSGATKAANNAARSELLVSLAKTYGVGKDLWSKEGGKIHFEDGFIAELKRKLSDDMVKTLKLDSAFKMKDGHVVCGKPLTERRISAVNAQTRSEFEKECKNRLGDALRNLDSRMTQRSVGGFGQSGVDLFVDELMNITQGKASSVNEKNVEKAINDSFKVHIENLKVSQDETLSNLDTNSDPFKECAPDVKNGIIRQVVTEAKKLVSMLANSARPIAAHAKRNRAALSTSAPVEIEMEDLGNRISREEDVQQATRANLCKYVQQNQSKPYDQISIDISRNVVVSLGENTFEKTEGEEGIKKKFEKFFGKGTLADLAALIANQSACNNLMTVAVSKGLMPTVVSGTGEATKMAVSIRQSQNGVYRVHASFSTKPPAWIDGNANYIKLGENSSVNLECDYEFRKIGDGEKTGKYEQRVAIGGEGFGIAYVPDSFKCDVNLVNAQQKN